MNREKYIYLLGGLFLILVILKYLFVPSVFPPVYYTIEVLSLLLILGLIFYVGKYFMLKKSCNDQQLKDELEHLKKEKEKLLNRIEVLETVKNEEHAFLTTREKLLADLNTLVSKTESDDLGKGMFKLVKKHYELVAGILYQQCEEKDCFHPILKYGLDDEWEVAKLVVGEGLHGQVIKEQRAVEYTDIPEDYLMVSSGTGNAQPAFIYFLPLINKGGKDLLIEIASFKKLGLDIIWNEFVDGLQEPAKK